MHHVICCWMRVLCHSSRQAFWRGQPERPGLRMLVSGVVVGDGIYDLAGWHGRFDGIEKADELRMAVALHA